MVNTWCWRCQRIVPMFTQEQPQEIERFRQLMTEHLKLVRTDATPLILFKRWWTKQKVLNYYKKVGGIRIKHINIILHHFREYYGNDCKACGKPYRTSKAMFCAACGNRSKQHPIT